MQFASERKGPFTFNRSLVELTRKSRNRLDSLTSRKASPVVYIANRESAIESSLKAESKLLFDVLPAEIPVRQQHQTVVNQIRHFRYKLGVLSDQ